MRSSAYYVTSSLGALVLLSASAASAQTIDARGPAINNSVSTKTAIPATVDAQATHPEDTQAESLEPVGARLGSFMLYPRVEGALTYNDNIYALADKTDDFIARVSPSLDLRGDFGTATTDLRATVDRYEYFDHSTENRTDWSLGGNGQVEVERGSFLYAAGGYSHAHEDRGDPNQTYTDRKPTSYYLGEAGLGLSAEAQRLRYGFDLSVRSLNFQNNEQINGATTNNNDRDRNIYRAAGRLGFEFSPGYVILARGSYDKVHYSDRIDDGGFDRRADGYRGTVGLQFELTRLLTGEVFGGYLHRNFSDPRFRDIGAFVYGSSLEWTPTQLTTVTLTGDRTVQETIVAGYSSFLSTNFTLKVVHELLRNVTLNASASYGHDNYQRANAVVVPSRSDNNYGFTVGGRYIFTRNLYAGLAYDWSKRSSDVVLPGIQFNRNRLTATAGVQF